MTGLLATVQRLWGFHDAGRGAVRAHTSISAALLCIWLCPWAWSQTVSPPPAGPPQPGQATADLPDAPQPPAASAAPERAGQPATGSIRGQVLDKDGAAYQGVHVALTQANSESSGGRTVATDNGGRFQFNDVPPGAYRLTVSAGGFATQVVPVQLQPGESFETSPIALHFATATSEVRVTASQVEVAQAQLNEEEHQRVLGAIPNFYVVYEPHAAPLNPRQKFHLAWRTAIDPMTFLGSGFSAGIEQANNDFSGYGQGAEGYAKRFGASYADGFIGNMIGGALLPSLLKQDPRYFYKGTGTTRSRVLYAIANSVACKGDNGRWQANYSGILGGMAAGGISNLYYPAKDRNGATLTFENAGLGIAGSAVQNLLQEFVIRKLTPKAPGSSAGKP